MLASIKQDNVLAPDDDVAAMYVEAMERLERAGYRQYEISNVARPGFQSRHNLKYWTGGEWRVRDRVHPRAEEFARRFRAAQAALIG